MKNMRIIRHKRIRNKIKGTEQKPRLSVFRSSKNIFAQIIDDVKGETLVSASTLGKDFQGKTSTVEAAFSVGEVIAKKAVEKGITKISFDRGGYLYHGKIKSLADGARKGGLKF